MLMTAAAAMNTQRQPISPNWHWLGFSSVHTAKKGVSSAIENSINSLLHCILLSVSISFSFILSSLCSWRNQFIWMESMARIGWTTQWMPHWCMVTIGQVNGTILWHVCCWDFTFCRFRFFHFERWPGMIENSIHWKWVIGCVQNHCGGVRPGKRVIKLIHMLKDNVVKWRRCVKESER